MSKATLFFMTLFCIPLTMLGQVFIMPSSNDTGGNSIPVYYNFNICFDCNSAKAKAEFLYRWRILDSISQGQLIPSSDSMWAHYCHSLGQVTQIHADSSLFPDKETIKMWGHGSCCIPTTCAGILIINAFTSSQRNQTSSMRTMPRRAKSRLSSTSTPRPGRESHPYTDLGSADYDCTIPPTAGRRNLIPLLSKKGCAKRGVVV